MIPQSSSLDWLRRVLLLVCVVTLGWLWGLCAQQKFSAQREALEAKAAEHLNLATVAAEDIGQWVDRAQTLGKLARRSAADLDPGRGGVARMLAEDPLIKRLSLYDPQGIRLSTTDPDEPQTLPANWLEQIQRHRDRYGYTPLMPGLAQASPPQATREQLPFLLPLIDPATDKLDAIMLVQLDAGYLAALFKHIELGASGMLRLLDQDGQERLRLDNRGIAAAGAALSPALPSGGDEYGEFTQQSSTAAYQSLYRRMPQRGFSVVVSQQRDEILAPACARLGRQLWLNLAMTIFIVAGMWWILRGLSRRHQAFEALEEAQQVNQQLISRLEEQHQHSSKAAATDHLSGLHNRRHFLEIAHETLLRQRNRRRLMALLFIDMDRFKSINDSLGHKVGDLLLQAIARRIERLLEPTDTAARFGGDEFVVLLAGKRTEAQIEAWVSRLVSSVSVPYVIDGQQLNTSPSVGVSVCPRDGQNVEQAIRHADAAMYSAKRAGRAQYRFFDPSLNVSDVKDFLLEQAFAAALSDRQFVLHFQPQVNLASMCVDSYEALVRWQHPEFGLLYPDRFIDLAERSGFIVALGWEVLRLACEELSQWRVEGKSMVVAINVSPLQLRQADFSYRVLAELQKRHIVPHHLEIEITETIVIDDEPLAIAHLQRLREAGMQISLDDFGKGYAGFGHLQKLPLTKLKIDRSVIAPLVNSPDDSPIVSSTIILAKRMGLTVVAEGVETRENLICLRLAGCDAVQGYHFSRPLSAVQLRAYAPFRQPREKASAHQQL
ncbi:EAL domain-containing protein [Pseudomonas sp. HR96]|uniref:bifunctional diguanylate cyclase/phosphodiesterase n=1 Tax=Pseudomonas sp. HR96 TaxID=1027966 RepID=UPI002A7667EF|nr:EAL domain-containing protein [Pseudomonas sp. HR96]WPO97956.1 EAL domain-containing protein [Pseudomonas sp. HR96]